MSSPLGKRLTTAALVLVLGFLGLAVLGVVALWALATIMG